MLHVLPLLPFKKEAEDLFRFPVRERASLFLSLLRGVNSDSGLVYRDRPQKGQDI